MNLKIIPVFMLYSFIAFSSSYAFIPGPPFTTYSAGMFISHFDIFIVAFLLSILFQGLFISIRHDKITFIKATIESFIVKIVFILYAFPLLVLADILGFSFVALLFKLSLNEYLNDTVAGIVFFSSFLFLGITLIVYVVSKIETYSFGKKYKDINKKSLRHTITIANTIVFIVAFIIVGVSS